MENIVKYFPDLTKEQLSQFSALKETYLEWNSKINVISRKDMDEFYLRHVLHSLAIGKLLNFKAQTKILDVGTGGGFPGVPLAILFPEVSFTLVDSIGKKIRVVDAVCESLSIKNVRAFHQRAELSPGKFDFIVSRAVTQVSAFLPWVEGKLSGKSFNDIDNGYLFLKGGDLSEEFASIKSDYYTFPLSEYFQEVFFETKQLIYLPR